MLYLRICVKKILLYIAGISFCAALFAINYSEPIRLIRSLPPTLHLSQDPSEDPDYLRMDQKASGIVPVTASTDERLSQARQSSDYTYRLFHVIPLRTITVERGDSVFLVPGGSAVGITIRTNGVLVVGLGSVVTEQGTFSPGASAGLVPGDTILEVNGTTVENAVHLSKLCESASNGAALTVLRDGQKLKVTATPQKDADDGVGRLGIWVRDSTAGVGTFSFYDRATGWFAALGHPVSDVDTETTLSIREGKIVRSEIVDVIRGKRGEPGELLGVFSASGAAEGELRANSEFGIFGVMNAPYENALVDAVPLGYAYEAHLGEATVLTTVAGDRVEAFQCEISHVDAQDTPSAKGLVVTVTDETLLDLTGGIVQGMSGSPVIQDGKLVAIVTHVFVNDPTKGYCVYAEWMFRQMQLAAS